MNRFCTASSCLLLIAFATVAYSAPVQDDYMCCPPDKFHTTTYGEIVTFVNNKSQQSGFKYATSVDYAEEQLAIQGEVSTGEKIHMIIRPNYTYVIDDDKQSCVVNRSIPYTPKKCVPKSVKYVGDVIYGNLTTKAYWIEAQGQTYFFTLTKDCLSVNQITTVLTHVFNSVGNFIYSDIKPGVPKSAFDVPSFCPKP